MRLLRAELARLFARRFTRWMVLLLIAVLATVTAAIFTFHRGSAFAFWQEMPDLIVGYGTITALFAYPVAASFVGAEWASGGVATLLMWRPRRLAVFTGKLLALLVGIAGVYVAVGAAWVGSCWLLAHRAGPPGRGSRQLVESFATTGARGLGLAVFAAIVGFAIASLGRRTAVALGVAAGYLLVGEIGARMAMAEWNVATPDRYLLLPYLEAWLTTPYGSSWITAAGVLGGVAAVLLILAVMTFQRRDPV